MSHGIVFARKIIEQVPDKDKEKVKEIEIEVGELAEIGAEELKKAVEDVTGWRVIVSEMPSESQCDCGYVGRVRIRERGHHIVLYDCPKCGSVPRVIVGQDIKLKKVVYY